MTFFLVSCLLLYTDVSGQQLPLFSQYFYNPYLVNPSMVAHTGSPELNLLYRRQWSQIQDGPRTLQFDAQLPIDHRMAIGFNVYNDKSVMLSATSALVTFGYKIQLARDHTLGFGLSAGIFTNQLDLSAVAAVDATDPALLSSASNNMAMNSQFGAHYIFKRLTLGFSLVSLVDRKTFTPESFQKPKFGQLNNQILTATYRHPLVADTWFVQPNLAYRLSEDNINYYEASAVVSYRNKIDVGGGYRQNFGPMAVVHIALNQLQIGFAYDFPSTTAQVSPGGTQEFQLKWRMGKESTVPTTAVKKNSTLLKEEENVVHVPRPDSVPHPEQKIEATPTPELVNPFVANREPHDYYFVIGTFEVANHAEEFYHAMIKKGLRVEIKESKPTEHPHYFYVHMPEYKTTEPVNLERILELQKITGFKDGWYKDFD